MAKKYKHKNQPVHVTSKTSFVEDEDGLFIVFSTARNLDGAFEAVEQYIGEPLAFHENWEHDGVNLEDEPCSRCVLGLASVLLDD